MAFCIIPELANTLKIAAKTGEITMQKLFEMSEEDGAALFGKYTDPTTAKQIYDGFKKGKESVDEQVMSDWLKQTFSTKEKAKPAYKDMFTKLHELKKNGKMTPEGEKSFLQDAISQKMGVTLSEKETEHIVDLSTRLEQESKTTSQFGTKTKEYYMAKREMDKYVESLNPTHNLRVFTSTIGRGAMLLSLKSPLLNVSSNSIVGFLQVAERRILQRRFNGFNNDVAGEYRKFATDVYKDTGYDLSRFQSFGEGHKVRGEDITHSQGSGAVRAIGRFFEDVAFNKMQGLPDAAFSAFHFSDSANLSSSVLALKEGLSGPEAKQRALTILQDAFKEAPQSKEGQYVRAQAEADALYSTFTNKTLASDVALKFRGIVNTATGDLRLGDITDPFVKTPANVLSAGLDYSGATVTAKMGVGILKALNDVAHRREFDKTNFADVNKYMVRAGMGITFAYVISQMIKPQDFLGQYPTTPTEQKLFESRNGVANSIKIGDKWVSLDYLSTLGAPLLAFLYAKKYSNGSPLDNAYRYSQGVGATLQNLPGLNTIMQAGKYITTPPSKKTTASEAGLNAGKAILGSITSRIVPGIVTDLANMTDGYKRSSDKGTLTGQMQAQLPRFRKDLPISRTTFGDPITTENWVSTLLFGSRVKTAKDSTLINELVRLNQEGELPSITDVSKSSKAVGEFKAQVSKPKFEEAMAYFGKNLKANMLESIQSEDYKAADSPLAQKKMLDKVKLNTLQDMLDTYGYVKAEKP